MMRKWILAAIAVVLLGVAGFVAMRMLTPPPADLDLARSKPSAAGIYAVAIEPEVEPVQQGSLHTWIVQVSTADGASVTDAELTVGGGMPQHGHGLPTAPQSAGHIGEGRYRIEGVRFNMGGWWELTLGISAPAGEDSVTFNIVL